MASSLSEPGRQMKIYEDLSQSNPFWVKSDVEDGATSMFRPWKGPQALLALEATLGSTSPVVCLTQFQWPMVRAELQGMAYYRGFLHEVWGEVLESKSMAVKVEAGNVRSTVLQTMQKFLPNGLEGLTDEAEFDELGLDSLSGVEASRALGAALAPLGITGIKPTFLFEANCLKAVMAKLPVPEDAPASTAAPPADVKEVVIATVQQFLPGGKEGLTEAAEFDELGLDSLSGVEASRALAVALAPLGITGLKPTFLFEANTLRAALAKLLTQFLKMFSRAWLGDASSKFPALSMYRGQLC